MHGERLEKKTEHGDIFTELETYHLYTFPRARIYQESVLDDRFQVCVVISYHYKTTDGKPQSVNNR